MRLSSQMSFEWLTNRGPCLRREETIQLSTSCLNQNTEKPEAKTYQKTDFLSSEGHLLTSPGCRLTLTSSLDVETSEARFTDAITV